LACGDQRRLTGNGSALEVVLHDDALYKSTTLLFLLQRYQLLMQCRFNLTVSTSQSQHVMAQTAPLMRLLAFYDQFIKNSW